MLLDDECLFLLEKIYLNALNGKVVTTWEIAKEKFLEEKKNNRNLDEKSFMLRKNIFYRERLDSLAKLGLIEVTKDEKKSFYKILGDKIIYQNRHRFADGYKKAIQIKLNGKWIACQI